MGMFASILLGVVCLTVVILLLISVLMFAEATNRGGGGNLRFSTIEEVISLWLLICVPFHQQAGESQASASPSAGGTRSTVHNIARSLELVPWTRAGSLPWNQNSFFR